MIPAACRIVSTNPQRISLLAGETLWGFFAFMDLCSQTRFLCLWVQMYKRAEIVKGQQVP